MALNRNTMGWPRAVVIASFCLAFPALASAQDAKAVTGEKVFTDQKCTLCHSVGGHGNPKGPLDDVGSKLSADEIRQWITDRERDVGQDEGAAQAGDEAIQPAQGRCRRARGLLADAEEEKVGGDHQIGAPHEAQPQ